jgi:hypothetical protein
MVAERLSHTGTFDSVENIMRCWRMTSSNLIGRAVRERGTSQNHAVGDFRVGKGVSGGDGGWLFSGV